MWKTGRRPLAGIKRMTGSTMPKSGRLFITGTDTAVGKTHVTCLIARQLIARQLRVAAYKPVCSGAIEPVDDNPRWDDIERLKAATGHVWTTDQICAQRFVAPLAPPIAARLEGKSIDFAGLIEGARKFDSVDLLLIEGAGGWLSPVTEIKTNADLAQALEAPILVVARTGLGTINHTLLTIESIRRRGLKIAGVVLNRANAGGDDQSGLTNAAEIEAHSGVPVFGTVAFGSELELRQSSRLVAINWSLLAAST